MANAMNYMFYKERTDAPLFLINGKQMPYIEPTDYVEIIQDGVLVRRLCTANPAREYQEKSEQLVRSTRNADGEVIAETINRRLNKFDSLKWPYLARHQVTWLKKEIAKFYCDLSYYDTEVDGWITRKYYWGDFSATPCEWEVVRHNNSSFYYKRPTKYKDVSVNLIDTGIGGTKIKYTNTTPLS